MVGKNKVKQHMVEKGNKTHRFTIRKLKVGVASVSLGALLMMPSGAVRVSAEEVNAEVSVAQISNITPENLVYENERLSLINQEPGTRIVAILPNDKTLEKTVPFHGTWQPLQTLAAQKVYPGDEIEFFTYDDEGRSESVFLTITGEGEERPADQGISYGRQAFGFIPTVDSTNVTYKTEPFFTVELTFPDGSTETQTASQLGQTRFYFPESYQAAPGDTFSVNVFNRRGELVDLKDPNLFTNPELNQSSIAVYGEVVEETPKLELPRPNTLKNERLPHGTTIHAKDFVTNSAEFPEGTTFEFYDYNTQAGTESLTLDVAPNPEFRNQRLVIRATHPDAVNFVDSFSFTVIIDAVHTVTIDPNGGTIDEAFASTEVTAKETYTLPYGFQSKIAREGYTLTGYTVNGTLLDANGNPVTEIAHYSAAYTPKSAVTLTANWAETAGGIRILLHDDNPAAQTEKYTVTLTAEDGTEYVLASNSYGQDSRTWELEDVPNGTYTLSIDGFTILEGEKNGHPDTSSAFTANEDGTATVELGFEDDSSTTFIRYKVYGEAEEAPISLENSSHILARLGYYGSRYYRNTITVVDENGRPVEGLTQEDFRIDTYGGIVNFEANGNVYTLDTEYADALRPVHSLSIGEDGVIQVNIEEEVEEPEVDEFSVGFEVRGLDGKRTIDVGITVTDAAGTVFAGSYNEYSQWLSTAALPAGNYTVVLETPEGTAAEINDTVTTQHAVATDQANVFSLAVNAENQGSLSAVYGAFRLVEEAPVEASYSVGVEIRDTSGKRTTEVGVTVTDAEGTVFEGSYNEYSQWLTEQTLPAGDYTITLETPDGFVAEINDTVALQNAVATDQANVFSITVNAENQGSLSAVYAAFKLEAVEEPAPETDADHHEPVFVDEIVLDLNRGNGKLKNPKTLIENMNELPGGIKVAYTNLDQVDLSGKTTEQQMVEITVTYRDGSTDTVAVPLQVIPEKQAQKPGRPIFGGIVRVVKSIVGIIGSIFSRWF